MEKEINIQLKIFLIKVFIYPSQLVIYIYSFDEKTEGQEVLKVVQAWVINNSRFEVIIG